MRTPKMYVDGLSWDSVSKGVEGNLNNMRKFVWGGTSCWISNVYKVSHTLVWLGLCLDEQLIMFDCTHKHIHTYRSQRPFATLYSMSLR